MNTPKTIKTLNPHPPSLAYRVGDKVYNQQWKPINISIKKGWHCVKLSGKWVGVSTLSDRTGYSEPVYFGYIFEGLFQAKPNSYYDQLLQ